MLPGLAMRKELAAQNPARPWVSILCITKMGDLREIPGELTEPENTPLTCFKSEFLPTMHLFLLLPSAILEGSQQEFLFGNSPAFVFPPWVSASLSKGR